MTTYLPPIDTTRALQIIEEQENEHDEHNGQADQSNLFDDLTHAEQQNLATSRSDSYDLFSSQPPTDRKYQEPISTSRTRIQSSQTSARLTSSQTSARLTSSQTSARLTNKESARTKAIAIRKQLDAVLTARKLAAASKANNMAIATQQNTQNTTFATHTHIIGQQAKKIRQSVNYSDKGTVQSVQTEIIFDE